MACTSQFKSGIRSANSIVLTFALGIALATSGIAAATATAPSTGTPACAVAPIDELNMRPAPDLTKFMDTSAAALLQEHIDGWIGAMLEKDPVYSHKNFPNLIDQSDKALDAQIKKASFIIHVVLWAAPAGTGGAATQTVQEQSWYVYTKGKLSMNPRLYGARDFYFIYLHLNVASNYRSKYQFAITKTTPLPLQNLNTLLSFITTAGAAAGQGKTLKAEEQPPKESWGGREISSDCSTADIVITPGVVGLKTSVPGAQDAGSKSGDSNDAFSTPQTFHNEVASWWDVSVAFPVTSVNQLKFDSTANGLVPSKIDKKSLYGLVNLYWLPAQRMDIAKNGFSWYPSIIAGIPMAGQPLHKPLFGMAWGPPLAQLYFGTAVVKQPVAPTGTSSSACTGWCPQFSFGIDFGVKALAGKAKSTN